MYFKLLFGLVIILLNAQAWAGDCPDMKGRFLCPASSEDAKPFPPYSVEFTSMKQNGAPAFKMDIEFQYDKKPKKSSHTIVMDGKKHGEKSEMGQPVEYSARCENSKVELVFKMKGKGEKKKTYFIDKEGFFYLVTTIGKTVSVEKCPPAKK